MIPKCIHYCWFGRKPLPEFAKRCIASWRKYMPDYEILEWNEDNFDITMFQYTYEAYNKKKFAFVSDVARFWILYHHGGIYFDVDVELLKPLTEVVSNGPYMGLEQDNTLVKGIFTGADLGVACNPGLGMAASAGMPFCKEMLSLYKSLRFCFPSGAINTKTVVSYTSELLLEKGYDVSLNGPQECGGFVIYPKAYFCPTIHKDKGSIELMPETISVHHYAATWVDGKMRFKGHISRVLARLLPTPILKAVRAGYRWVLRKK